MSDIPRTRQVIAVHGDGQLRRIEESIPPLEPGKVLIKVKASLVSPGSELGGGWQALRQLQLNPTDAPPRKIGYSVSGTIIATGECIKTVKVGDEVFAVGAGYAQHADYVVVPQNLVLRKPESVTHAQASYGMLLATGLQAIRRGDPKMGEYVAVAGLGLVGLLTARLLQLAGCRVIGWDTNPARIKNAQALGVSQTVHVGPADAIEETLIFTSEKGLDHGVIAIGDDVEQAYDSLVECMKVTPDGHAMGNLIIVGGAHFPYKKNLSNLNIIRSSRTGPGYHDKGWELGGDYPLVHVRWTTRSNLELCINLVAEGKIKVDSLTTHVVPFDEVETQTRELTKDPDSLLGMVFTMD